VRFSVAILRRRFQKTQAECLTESHNGRGDKVTDATHGNCAATEGHPRLHAEHPDIEERARLQNCVVHKPFVAKENRVRTRNWPLFTKRTRLCLLAKAFEAIQDRKKSRTSSRFISTDAVAHL
jgi:hypothetical protein